MKEKIPKTTPEILRKLLDTEILRSIISIYPFTTDEFEIEYFDDNFKIYSSELDECKINYSLRPEDKAEIIATTGFDVDVLLKNTTDSEFKLNTHLSVLEQIKNLCSSEKYEWDSLENFDKRILSLASENNSDFLIVNAALGTFLQNTKYSVVSPNGGGYSLDQIFFSQGTFAGIEIFVDPRMKWKDTTIYMGKSTPQNHLGIYLAYNSHYLKYNFEEGWSKIKYRVGLVNNIKPKGFKTIKLSEGLIDL